MPDAFHKFPQTFHLVWLGDATLREDKLLTPEERRDFLSSPIVVEEKIDGANLGLSFDSNGNLRFQNRGTWLVGRFSGQWEQLRYWADSHQSALRDVLPENHVLFGEWCYAVHSIRYDCLPDWFVGFDVYDSQIHRFWSTRRRDALLKDAGISKTPRIAEGVFNTRQLRHMLKEPSAFGGSPREGLYLRLENNIWLEGRAKLVSPAFSQQIAEHWTKKPTEINAILCPSRVKAKDKNRELGSRLNSESFRPPRRAG
jgi:hypothetical protein